MSLSYSIDRPAQIVTIHFDENPQFVEFRRVMETIFNDSKYQVGFRFLLDRHLVKDPPSTQYIRQVAEFYKNHQARFSRLAVVVNDSASYGMERMTQILTEDAGVHLEIFKNAEAAKERLRSV